MNEEKIKILAESGELPIYKVELIWKEAQKELLEEIKGNFIPLNLQKDFDNWVKREVSNK